MKSIYLIIIGVLLGVAVGSGIYNVIQARKIQQLSLELNICKNTPSVIRVVYDTVHITDTVFVKPTPKPKPDVVGTITYTPAQPNIVVTVPGSLSLKCENIMPTYYNETYIKDSIKIHYEAMVECIRDSALLTLLRFSDIYYPSKTITVEVPAKPLSLSNKFGIYGGVTLNSFNTFPGVETGGSFLHKQNWQISAGGLYLNKLYGNFRITIFF